MLRPESPGVLVSVILPTYNVERYAREAIERLKSQTEPSIEFLIVDDGSTDETVSIVRQCIEGDGRFRLLELGSNAGVAVARAYAVDRAVGAWVWFVDADDHWPDDAVAKLLTNSGDADLVIGAARYVDDSGTSRSIPPPQLAELGGRDAFVLLLNGVVKGHLWNKLFSLTLLQTSVSFQPSRVHSDLAIVAEALAGAHTVKTVSAHIYDYRMREGSIVRSHPQRRSSLEVVAQVVDRSAKRFVGDDEVERALIYFEHRFILLSMLKDANNRLYSAEERGRQLATVRRSMSWHGVWECLRRRDARRAVAVAVVKAVPWAAGPVSRRLSSS
ncbi:glycosyltransferase family 2 protein [Modestobacter sp. SYSU DS0511]